MDGKISPRPAKIVADDKSKPVGDPDPEFTATVEGTIGADQLRYSYSCEHEDVPGTYDIIVSVAEGDNPNYVVTCVSGRLTITNARISVAAKGYTGVYDGRPHGITVDVRQDSDATVYYSEQELTDKNYQTVGSTTPVTRTDVGTTTVNFLVVASSGEMIAGHKDVTILKGDSVFTKMPEGRQLEWTGAAQELVIAGSAEGGTLQYSLDNAAWSEALPVATDPGVYTVFYRAVGDDGKVVLPGGSVTSTITKKEEPENPSYRVTGGAGVTWTKGSTDGHAITVKRYVGDVEKNTFVHFKSASLDGAELVEGSQYTKAEGSVIVTLLPAHLNTLAAGEHTLTTTFDDGSAEAKFIVAEAAKPATTEVAITFDSNGGTGSMAKVTTPAGKAVTLPANAFTRNGYKFVGWNTKADNSGASYADGASVEAGADLTLYAQWSGGTTTSGTTSGGGTTTTTGTTSSGGGTTTTGTTTSGGTTTTSGTTSSSPTAKTGDSSLPMVLVAIVAVVGVVAAFVGIKNRRHQG